MTLVGIAEAKAKFAALIDRAAAGEEIVITRKGEPIARLSALAEKFITPAFDPATARVVGEAMTNAAPVERAAVGESMTNAAPRAVKPSPQRPGLTMADMMKLSRG